MTTMVKELRDLYDAKKDAEGLFEQSKAEYKAKADAIQEALEEAEMQQHKVPGVALVSLRSRLSVQTPKTNEEKEALFGWLRDKGIFLDKVSINSRTLNSLYQAEYEAQLESGVADWRMPGVGEPVVDNTLSLRKA